MSEVCWVLEEQRAIIPGPDLGNLTASWGQTGLKQVCLGLEPRVMVELTFTRLFSRAMFCNDLKEKYEKRIIIKGVDAETMHVLLDYTYTSKALITKQNVQRVLEAANLFQVREQTGCALSSGAGESSDSQTPAWTGSQACTWEAHTYLGLCLLESQKMLLWKFPKWW